MQHPNVCLILSWLIQGVLARGPCVGSEERPYRLAFEPAFEKSFEAFPKLLQAFRCVVQRSVFLAEVSGGFAGVASSLSAHCMMDAAKHAPLLRSEPPTSAPPMEVRRGCSRAQSAWSVALLPSGLARSA